MTSIDRFTVSRSDFDTDAAELNGRPASSFATASFGTAAAAGAGVVCAVAAATGGQGDFRLALSRNDTWATLTRMMLRDQMLDVIEALDGARAAALGQAGRHRTTVMMAHTHHQHAQPAHQLRRTGAVLR